MNPQINQILPFLNMNMKNRCLWNTNTPLTQHTGMRIRLTFDLKVWPTDPNIDRDSFTKGSSTHQGLSTYQTWPLTLTFDLLTWISIGIIYPSRTIYLPSYQVWSFWGKAFLSYQLHKVKGDRHTDLPTNMYRHSGQRTDMCKAICPSFFKGGHKYWSWCLFLIQCFNVPFLRHSHTKQPPL